MVANNNKFFVKAEIASFSPIGIWLAFLNDCFKGQMCLLSSVACFRFSFRNELVWFRYLVLNVPSVKPT